MKHSVEITETAFNNILLPYHPDDIKRETVECEHCLKEYFSTPDGTRMLQIFNYVSVVAQYYIQDINA